MCQGGRSCIYSDNLIEVRDERKGEPARAASEVKAAPAVPEAARHREDCRVKELLPDIISNCSVTDCYLVPRISHSGHLLDDAALRTGEVTGMAQTPAFWNR